MTLFETGSSLLAVLLASGCLSVSSVEAGENISAYLDSQGRVVFANEPPAVIPAQPTASPGDASGGVSPSLHWLIEQAANEQQVDPDLIRAIVQVESNFNPYAVSPRGARGLMQLIPATARRFGVRNIFDPRANLRGGIRYLKYLMEMYGGDLRLSLSAYNAGENAVDRDGGIPLYRETRDYLRKIERIYPLESSPKPLRQSTNIVKFVDPKGTVHFSNTDLP